MKRLPVVLVATLLLLAGCTPKEAQPAERLVIVGPRDQTYCGYCGGWLLFDEDKLLRADVPPAYAIENNKVFIRYTRDQRPGYKEAGWVTIKSIRLYQY